MSIPGKVLIALLCALVTAAAFSTFNPEVSLLSLLPPAAVSALAAVVLSHRALPVPNALSSDSAAKAASAAAAMDPARPDPKGRQPRRDKAKEKRRSSDKNKRSRKDVDATANRSKDASVAQRDKPSADLEEGTVKWFNVTKGYGFIIRNNGEEIFVHHRSVHGDGRGRLDDGVAVRFRVAVTDKGPQAEDVQAL